MCRRTHLNRQLTLSLKVKPNNKRTHSVKDRTSMQISASVLTKKVLIREQCRVLSSLTAASTADAFEYNTHLFFENEAKQQTNLLNERQNVKMLCFSAAF